MPLKIAARWRYRLPINNLTAHYNSQFCVSFHFGFAQEDISGIAGIADIGDIVYIADIADIVEIAGIADIKDISDITDIEGLYILRQISLTSEAPEAR